MVAEYFILSFQSSADGHLSFFSVYSGGTDSFSCKQFSMIHIISASHLKLYSPATILVLLFVFVCLFIFPSFTGLLQFVCTLFLWGFPRVNIREIRFEPYSKSYHLMPFWQCGTSDAKPPKFVHFVPVVLYSYCEVHIFLHEGKMWH